jgi:choline dehydrogenase-like flavoprotein
MIMATSPFPLTTDFARDVIGRYVCNGIDEAMKSTDKNLRPDARPFDIVIIGSGTFGSVLAAYLLDNDITHSHRILVLESGPLVLTEHVQNMPMMGLDPASSTTIAELKDPTKMTPQQVYAWSKEVWGLPWISNIGFPGLAYCLGGRSLYFGGWSPEPLASETPLGKWPANVLVELGSPLPDGTPGYYRQAGEEIGISETNDFIYGPLHSALRSRMFDGINSGQISDVISLSQLPDHPVIGSGIQLTPQEMLRLLGITSASGMTLQDLKNMLKLEAPLAVRARDVPGFFPLNKFSSMQLLIKASRLAQTESGGDDVKKRLMVIPFSHVKKLQSIKDNDKWRVTGIDVDILGSPFNIGVPDKGIVIVALGTIESTRLALLSFADPSGTNITNSHLLGKNLLAHLRSNLTIRLPRSVLPLDPQDKSLQVSALFLKGRRQMTNGSLGHFHLQVTASGGDTRLKDSEARLFKKVPDLDTLDALRKTDDTHVIITIRGIGQMESQNPNSSITLAQETDEYGMRRALVKIAPTAADEELWEAMDKASDDLAEVFMGGLISNIDNKVQMPSGDFERISPGSTLKDMVPYTFKSDPVKPGRRDGLGTTHHEVGTLWMGENPNSSVTDENCRFHYVPNAYVAGPAIFPTIGSPNPMLAGVALTRRLADHLVPQPESLEVEEGFTLLFNGFSTIDWRMSTVDQKKESGPKNPGRFIVVDGSLESVPGDALGLYWYTKPMPPDYVLRLEWLRWRDGDNSGVFVRFPHPDSKGYANTAWVAVHFGFEVQIDEFGAPDGAEIHRTGAIYNESSQSLSLKPAKPAGEWNEFEITVQGQAYTVKLNGEQVASFQNPNLGRGLPSTPTQPSFIGFQSYPGSRVAFRRVRMKSL